MRARTKVLGQQPVPVAWLVRTSGSDAGRDWKLGAAARIGRDTAENDIVFADDTVSWKHARIQAEGNQFVLYDLGSLNGTFVNEVKTQKTILYDGDSIRFGDIVCLFKRT